MMKAKETVALDACQQQFITAQTMTDQIASFSLLANCTNQGLREQAIEDFYKQWAKDDLVLDKWFTIQATSELSEALSHVKSLLQHSAFSIKNPNKVRALIGAFCMANPRNFHTIDGSGYDFLTDMLVTLDKINPQIAARIANPFTRWQRYDKSRQILMRHQLELLAKQNLSRDLAEVVTKSLVADVQ
jgi:aminopeptidase N